jgi:hypothetical protein
MLVTRLSSRYALAGRPDAMDFDDGGSTAMTVVFVGGQTP